MAHTVYLTHAEYVGMGGLLSAAEFCPLELKSRKRIDYLTNSRIQSMEAIPESVKLCMFALISMENAIGVEAQAEMPAITSFSTDGYSETYGNALSANEAVKQMSNLVKEYLYGETDDAGILLLYRGTEV